MGRLLPGLAAVALSLAVSVPPNAHAGRSRSAFSPSVHLEAIPNPGPCDVVITPANMTTTLAKLNDPTKRVFCVDPGDYRAASHVLIRSSGTAAAPRYLRYNASFPAPPAITQTSRAIFHGLILDDSSWWVVEGITVQPTAPQGLRYLVAIFGGTANVLTHGLLDASLQPNSAHQSGVVLGATTAGKPSTYNSIQNNVIRGGNLSRLPVDYTGVNIPSESIPGANNDYNKVLDNEIYDWGDAIQVSMDGACTDPARARGTIIDGNDLYITPSKRVRCSDGAPDPFGECSCAENGIDVKSPAGNRSDRWTQITNNRLWGFRPTLRDVPSCGGTGANGQAINAGNVCAANVFVAGNVVTDAPGGVKSQGGSWRIVGNLLSEIRTADEAHGNQSYAIQPLSGPGSLVQFNTVVAVDNAYQDAAADVTAQCNAVLHDVGIKGDGAPRAPTQVVRYNHLYESSSPNLDSATSRVFDTDEESLNGTYCFWRKRWTAAQEVCIPFGRTSATSPHATVPSECRTDAGAEFGIPAVTYP